MTKPQKGGILFSVLSPFMGVFSILLLVSLTMTSYQRKNFIFDLQNSEAVLGVQDDSHTKNLLTPETIIDTINSSTFERGIYKVETNNVVSRGFEGEPVFEVDVIGTYRIFSMFPVEMPAKLAVSARDGSIKAIKQSFLANLAETVSF